MDFTKYCSNENIDILVGKYYPTKDYIKFRDGISCYSFAGRVGKRQEIVFFERCADEHTLIHEVKLLRWWEFPRKDISKDILK